MRKAVLLAVIFSFITPLAFSADENTVALKGVIIDNMCAGAHKPEELGSFVESHTKECALMPDCAASGFSVFTDGKLITFDQESSVKIEEFLNKPGAKLQVAVVAVKTGDSLRLVSVENQ